jgi:5-methylcytosine-specific restriction endonuclease McrA
MARTFYTHVCDVCKIEFTTTKKIQRTCSFSCRGTYASSKHVNKICECGALGNLRGNCTECAHQLKKESRKRSYYKNREIINKKRKDQWDSKTCEDKLSISRKNKENRFNGHRIERLIKDNYTCQNCGDKEQLIVHHITHLPSGCTKDTWSTLEDLITLCRSCHINIHRKDPK